MGTSPPGSEGLASTGVLGPRHASKWSLLGVGLLRRAEDRAPVDALEYRVQHVGLVGHRARYETDTLIVERESSDPGQGGLIRSHPVDTSTHISSFATSGN